MKGPAAANVRFVSVYRVPGREEILYRLLKERPRRMNISHERLPAFSDHSRFVRSRPYKEWCFIQIKNEIAGAVYLSRLNEIGIFLFEKFRRQKLEKEAVKSFIAKRRQTRLLANVSPANAYYRNIFKSLGFRLIQHSYCLPRKSGARPS